MKGLLAALLASMLLLGAAGCAGSKSTGSTGQTAKSGARDIDNDLDKGDDDAGVLYYGQAAVGAEKQAIMSLVARYYAAEATANGSAACALLVPFVAESVVEDYGHNPGLRGSSCATVMSKLFEQQHKLLVAENATFKLYALRVLGDKALIVLDYSVLPEVRRMTARRIGGQWKVLYLLDGILE
jgi:hypothetical protein